ncbi:MAG TPA: phosphoribosylanthranilate isomerase [Rhizomicrobium sp.]|nr:phosphoribosylanthranilate isomerase [Rhizomicrobium sp.]
MAITVKICGLTSVEAANAAARAGATYGGLVFHPASPRNLSLEAAWGIASALRGKLKFVALVADADNDMLAAVIDAVRPDFLQLHGHESVARTQDIRVRFGAVIKALPIAEAADLAAIAPYDAVADMLLFDAKPPKGAARGGGHGAAFDWTLLKDRSFSKPWLLAGGLTSENVARAIALSGATMVDVSSGVESAPGVKSAEKIVQFIAAARQPVQA